MAEESKVAPTGDTAVPTPKVEAKAEKKAVPAQKDPAGPKPGSEGSADKDAEKAESGDEKGSLDGFADRDSGSGSGESGGGEIGVKGSLEEADDDSGEQPDGVDSGDGDDVELYELAFDDADPEGIRTLSEIGRKYGIPTEDAQKLGDAAMKYCAAELRKDSERTMKNYRDLRAGLKAELKERWGGDYSANIAEAKKGAAVLVRKYGFPADFDRQDAYAHLSDDVRFLNVLRDLHRHNSEAPHIQGDAKSMGGGDRYGDSLTAALGGE